MVAGRLRDLAFGSRKAGITGRPFVRMSAFALTLHASARFGARDMARAKRPKTEPPRGRIFRFGSVRQTMQTAIVIRANVGARKPVLLRFEQHKLILF